MNQHPAPPAPTPPIVVVQTTTDIFNQTTSIFSTGKNLHIFILLSFLFFIQRLHIDLTTHALTSYIDNQPSIKSFFSPNSTTIRRRFTRLPNPQSNATSVIHLQFDNGIKASEIPRSNSKFTIETNDSNDSSEVLYPFGVFIVSYFCLMGVFLLIQSYVHGVIFVLVMNQFCGIHNNSLAITFLNGFRLGFKRSYDIIDMKWKARGVITLFLCLCFFRGIEDQYSIIKILAREVFMPYTIFTPWVKGFEVESKGLIVPWLIIDFLVSFLLTLNPWIVMGDPTKDEEEVLKEGWHLLRLKFYLGFTLKGYESLVCGPIGRWVLKTTFGDLFGMAFQAFMEVYFLVAWLMYYLSVKSIHANSRGQPFGQPQLEVMLAGGG